MKDLRVAISGASSFTGLWIAKELRAQGAHVDALVPRSLNSYSGLRALRLRLLAEAGVQLHGEIRAETGAMEAWIALHRPRVWIHHHHFMENFRSLQFDSEKARQVALVPLESMTKILRETGVQKIVYSSTYFEPGEGGCGPQVLPYAVTKHETWKRLQELCGENSLSLSRVVIPNPIGPFENEDRLIPIILNRARTEQELEIKQPFSTADNLPIWTLAQTYTRAISEAPKEWRPSAPPLTTLELTQMAIQHLCVEGLGLSAPVLKYDPHDYQAKHARNSSQPTPVDWLNFWRLYSTELKKASYVP